MSRPERPGVLVLVTATGTEVGKTWVTAAAATELRRRGITVATRKPAQSFEEGTGPTDAEVLGAATGASPRDVCPPHRWYPVPLAPPMAADHLGRARITIADLVDETVWPDGTAVGFVEGAGGVRSPIAHDGDAVTLVSCLRPDVVLLVADPALGVVSHTRLAVGALEPHPVLVFLNRYDGRVPSHRRSHDWLADVDGFDIVTTIDEVVDAVTP